MTKKQLYKMTFEKAIEKLQEDNENITTAEGLKEFAIENIKSDFLLLATHILQALYNNDSKTGYYCYDYTMGTLETPAPLETLEDLEQFCD